MIITNSYGIQQYGAIQTTYTPANPNINNNVNALFELGNNQAVPQTLQYQADEFKNINNEQAFSIDDDVLPGLINEGVNVEDLQAYEYEYFKDQQEFDQNIDEEPKDNASMANKISRLKEHSDGMYHYAMKTTSALTINNLYVGSFTQVNNGQNNHNFSKEDVGHVLSMNSLPSTSQNTWAAEKLMNIGEDVSAANITKMQNLHNFVEAMDLPSKDVTGDGLPEYQPIIKEEKVMYIEKDMQEIVDDLTKVDDSDIEKVLSEDKDVTINNLRDAMRTNTEKALGTYKPNGKINTPNNAKGTLSKNNTNMAEIAVEVPQVSTDKITEIREQINIIRAKLNVEAARNISQKMPLESTELSQIAKELVSHQEQVITTALEANDVALTPANIEAVENVIDTTNLMKLYKEQSLAIQVESEQSATLQQFGQALSKYQENELLPEARFGEGAHKMGAEIKTFLQENNLPTDNLSVQAATGLVMNNQEITPENLESATQIALKMNTFLSEMTPTMASIMLKDGINPMHSNIDSAMEFIEEKRVPEIKKTVAQSIVALEQKGQIDADEKRELIGLYRILHGVESNKERVIGYLHANQLPLTVERLQEAVRYMGNANITSELADEFEFEVGGYKKRILSPKLASDAANVVHNSLLSSGKESTIANSLESMIFPFMKSETQKELAQFETLDKMPSNLLDKMEVAKKAGQDVVDALKERNIPVTISNLYLMQMAVDNPNQFGELLQQQIDQNEYYPESFDEIARELEEMQREAMENMDSAMLAGDTQNYQEHKSLEEMTRFNKSIQDQDGIYQIPFIIGGEPRTVHMYVKDDSKNKATGEINEDLHAVISYDTKHMGTIVANLKITPTSVSYEISGQSEEATNKLAVGSDVLNKMIEEIGYKVRESIYMPRDIYNPVANPSQEENEKLETISSDSLFEEIV
ncbi:MAG: hypothetical protein BEN18_09805 [Epulopiscium sp. Nuni2H_MBin001]|nr:MAG: hypothetical protein BEN18_09805 [Epulopiscium sp. Nuni2H_MBin001]